jgi:3-phosphoshikimate 1-carboxyvinyltransferase
LFDECLLDECLMSEQENIAGPYRASRSGPLRGKISPPGDKSISHRALLLAGMSVGETCIGGLLESHDIMATASALKQCGVTIERRPDAIWRVVGVGIHGLAQPDNVIDMGNSGTGARLFAGLLAAHPFAVQMTGDASLRRRPMGRIIEPLTQMGAQFVGARSGQMPMTVIGAETPLSIEYQIPVPSAQVKSAILLAALHADGVSEINERRATRDHTEHMLRHFGAELTVVDTGDGRGDGSGDGSGGRTISLKGQQDLIGRDLEVPGDPSSAAFAAAAAAIIPGSEIEITGLCTNPLRTGFFRAIEKMGAELTWSAERVEGGESVADLTVRAADLHGIDVPADWAPSMIDEYPILAVAAACATGRTVMHGLGELRVKESDRLAGIATSLAACGSTVEIEGDALIIDGGGQPPPGGATVATSLDHRMAMAFLVLGLVSDAPIGVDDAGPIATSYPDFVASFAALGADIAASEVIG